MDKYIDSEFPFLSVLEAVKTIPRKGWVIRGIPHPEHVGDHMYQMAIICMAHPKLTETERVRAIQLALVHDAGEAIVGDITPSDGITPEQKALREDLAFTFFGCLLKPSNPTFASRLTELWREYEDNTTEIAHLVRQVDKLECIQQAVIYDKRYRGEFNLDEFRALRTKIEEPWLSALADKALKEWDANKARRQSSPNIIFVIGGPGVGKGTQCARAAEEFNLAHISLGDLLRKERGDPNSIFGEFIDKSMQNSVIVPALLSMMLLKSAVENALAEGKTGVLLDGFPRSIEQASAFEEEISNQYSTILLDCSVDDMLERISGRASSSQRADDNPEVVQRRLETFKKSNGAIEQHLEKNPFRRISSAGSAEDVYAEFKQVVGQVLGSK
ncbi:adenylate kinase [Nemania abortiva]|nr:adenylate kinase [Nemania abortiva]